MATPTVERQKSTGYRRVANSRSSVGYREAMPTGSAVRVPEYPRTYPQPLPPLKPIPNPKKQKAEPRKVMPRNYRKAKRRQVRRTFFQIAGIFIMCSLMIYRYAMILETNDRITQMNQKVAELEFHNQFLEAKLDTALELGTIETYATEELGMMRPDSSQVFYVDVHMQDTMMNGEEEQRTLQGTPGALMNAIRVLK